MTDAPPALPLVPAATSWDFMPQGALEVMLLCAFGYLILLLGAIAHLLNRADDGYTQVFDELCEPKFLGNTITVFFAVVVPTLVVFLVSWRNNIREPALLLAAVPVFNAGLALDQVAALARQQAGQQRLPEGQAPSPGDPA